MVKKRFTTRLGGEVIEAAQTVAQIERRSVTSVIEVAVMGYAEKVLAAQKRLLSKRPVGDDEGEEE